MQDFFVLLSIRDGRIVTIYPKTFATVEEAQAILRGRRNMRMYRMVAVEGVQGVSGMNGSEGVQGVSGLGN